MSQEVAMELLQVELIAFSGLVVLEQSQYLELSHEVAHRLSGGTRVPSDLRQGCAPFPVNLLYEEIHCLVKARVPCVQSTSAESSRSPELVRQNELVLGLDRYRRFEKLLCVESPPSIRRVL